MSLYNITVTTCCFLSNSFATTDLHFHALKQCLVHGVDLVTPSYPCPQFLELGKEAAARGITVICEQGCDPGIDHMLAMKYIDKVHAQGGKVRETCSKWFSSTYNVHICTCMSSFLWPVGMRCYIS